MNTRYNNLKISFCLNGRVTASSKYFARFPLPSLAYTQKAVQKWSSWNTNCNPLWTASFRRCAFIRDTISVQLFRSSCAVLLNQKLCDLAFLFSLFSFFFVKQSQTCEEAESQKQIFHPQFIPQMFVMGLAGPSSKQEPGHSCGLFIQMQGMKQLGHLSLLSQAQQQEIRLDVQQHDLKLASFWKAGIIEDITYYAVLLVPEICLPLLYLHHGGLLLAHHTFSVSLAWINEFMNE